MQITILGQGEIGQAVLASLNPDNTIFAWDKRPRQINDQKELSEIIPNSELVFFCVPSAAVHEALLSVKQFLSKDAIIVCLAKGMEALSGKFVYQILEEQLPKNQYAILSGPMLAEELAKGQGAAGVAASENKGVLEKLEAVFKHNYLRLEYSANVRSVALAGVIKNVYTLILGISDGLGFGTNSKGFLVSSILPETESISKTLGLDYSIISGTAGLADFIATAFSLYSLNREAGVKIVQGGEVPQSEGLLALPELLKLLPENSSLPILNALKKIVIEKQNPQVIFEQLFYDK
jgi:glycerol-3-phosphate dehydrogenase (NAD(P)+)